MWVAVGELLLKRHTNPLSQINKEIRLEAYTEQSESNPGRSLGIINKEGTAVWKTVPTNYQQPTTNNQINHTKFAVFIPYSAFIISTFRYSLDFHNKLIIKHINKRKAK